MSESDHSTEMRERLHEIWEEWGVRPPEAASQYEALPALRDWLQAGAELPEIALRAAQCLLTNPDETGARKRACWKFVLKEIARHWAGIASVESPIVFVQALLLAAWPDDASEGHLQLVPLMEGTWEVVPRNEQQMSALRAWRKMLQSGSISSSYVGLRVKFPNAPPFPNLGSVSPQDLDQTLQSLRGLTHPNHYANAIPHIINILDGHKADLQALADSLDSIGGTMAKAWQAQNERVDAIVTSLQQESTPALLADEHELLWWGQARYSHALATPYRRIRDADEQLFWAAREAAELAIDLDVEPATSYLVETLHALGQDVDETKPLGQWMLGLHAALRRILAAHPDLQEMVAVSSGLDELAKEDALGLPITWTRQKAVTNQGPENAPEAIALPFDAAIDRGQWASWIFREILLDLHLQSKEGE